MANASDFLVLVLKKRGVESVTAPIGTHSDRLTSPLTKTTSETTTTTPTSTVDLFGQFDQNGIFRGFPDAAITSSTTGQSTTESGEKLSDFSLGLIIPLVIICMFLVVVGCCVMRHAWHDRWKNIVRGTPAGVQITSFHRNAMHGDMWEEWRGSTRSTTPLKITPTSERSDHTSISAKFNDTVAKKDLSIIQEESLTTLDSTYFRGDISTIQNTSRFGGDNISFIPDISQSMPALSLSPQAPFSPYHLTWISPAHSRGVFSDPNISSGKHFNPFRPPYNTPTESSISTYPSYPSYIVNNISWKSPYHPNYNTPTNGSETDSLALTDFGVINDNATHLTSFKPFAKQETTVVSVHEENKPEHASVGSSNNATNTTKHTSAHFDSSHRSNLTYYGTDTSHFTVDASASLSIASNIGTWHYNKLYSCPCHGVFELRNLPLNNTWSPICPSGKDMQLVNQQQCPRSTPTDVSMNPVAGSLNSSAAQPGLPTDSHNTSTCPQMGSTNTSIFDRADADGADVSRSRASVTDEGSTSTVPGTAFR